MALVGSGTFSCRAVNHDEVQVEGLERFRLCIVPRGCDRRMDASGTVFAGVEVAFEHESRCGLQYSFEYWVRM